MQSAKLRKDIKFEDIKFVLNQLLAVDKNSQSIMGDSFYPSIGARFQRNHANYKANYFNSKCFKLDVTKRNRIT